MTEESPHKLPDSRKIAPVHIVVIVLALILVIAAALLLQSGQSQGTGIPVTPAPAPDRTVPVPTTPPPDDDIPPVPSQAVPDLHIIENADRPSDLVRGGYLQFRVHGADGSSITHGGITYPLNANDVVTLTIGSDTRGRIEITPDTISRFSFDDVQLIINADEQAPAPVNSITVNGYYDFVSTLVLDTHAVPAWTRLEINKAAVIPGVTNNSRILLTNIRPYEGALTLDNIVNTRYTGGADSFTITPATVVPVAAFSGSPQQGVRPLAVSFTDTSANSPTSWQWDFGDSNMTGSTLQNPVHLYQNAGTYTVKLTVKNAAGSNTMIKEQYITANTVTPPVAGFTGSPTTGDQGLVVRFTDTSLNKPTSWQWDFGDGSTSADQNPSHTYTASGQYTVTLTAANAGGSHTVAREGYITTGSVAPPVAGFDGTPVSGSAGLLVRFTDTSTNAPASWQWDFGDGGNSTDKNPSHRYTAPGIYPVMLTVTNAGGSDIVTKDGYITITVSPPSARFTGSPVSGVVPLTVVFTDNSNNTPTSWQWDFGDGSTSADQNPSHLYTAPGTYSITLTSANAGGSTTVTRSGYIAANMITPAAGFTGKPTTGKVPLTVAFTDTSGYYPTAWAWDFGDGKTSTEKNPSHTYTSAGTYTVTLVAKNAAGSSVSTRAGYISASA